MFKDPQIIQQGINSFRLIWDDITPEPTKANIPWVSFIWWLSHGLSRAHHLDDDAMDEMHLKGLTVMAVGYAKHKGLSLEDFVYLLFPTTETLVQHDAALQKALSL